ncbi:hypothetical protein GQ457_05G008840 [Hibiscus cannabinus]
MMIKSKGLFLKEHSQWPPESFRLSPGLRAYAASLLPWMSETLKDFSFYLVIEKAELSPSPGLRAYAASLLPWMSETLEDFLFYLVLVSQNIRSGRLRAFAFAGLESLCCFTPSLDV